MKTLTALLLIITLASCGVKKSLTRLKTKASTLEKIDSNEKQLELHTYSNYMKLSDSTDHLYRITIYPTDSLFQFSLQEGFKGKATKVEITGLSKQSSHQSDSTTITTLTDQQKELNTVKKTTNKATSLDKTTQKNKNFWLWLSLCILLAMALSLVWARWRLRRLDLD